MKEKERRDGKEKMNMRKATSGFRILITRRESARCNVCLSSPDKDGENAHELFITYSMNNFRVSILG